MALLLVTATNVLTAQLSQLACPCILCVCVCECVREDMINPRQFIFRQAKLILIFILWNLFCRSFCVLFFTNGSACAVAGFYCYNHSWNYTRGVGFVFVLRLCVDGRENARNQQIRIRQKSETKRTDEETNCIG